jgi:hypothetical protein
MILSRNRSRRILPIRWAVQNRLRLPIDRQLGENLQNEFGPSVAPLIRMLPTIEFELRNGIGREVLDRYPASWVRLFERFFVDCDNQPDQASLRESTGIARTFPSRPIDKLPETGR